MRTGRSHIATAFVLGILSGCAAEGSSTDGKISDKEDWGDESKYPEVGGAFSTLTTLAGTCTNTSGALAISMTDSDQTLVMSVRAVDSQILVNGKTACGTGSVAGLTSKTLKTVAITVASNGTTGKQNVVIDLLGGLFAPGTKLTTGTNAPNPGISIDLGGTTGDTVALRGTSGKDLVAVGAGTAGSSNKPLVSFNTDLFPDMVLKSTVALTFSLAGDADTFTAAPIVGQNLGTVYTDKVSVFGGAGADKLTGGSGNDVLRGGSDADTLVGGLGDDQMYGEDGDDIVNAADVTDGKDHIDCGAGTADKMSYELRAANKPVRVSLEALVDFGADLALGGGDDVADYGADTALGGGDDVLVVLNDGEIDPGADTLFGTSDDGFAEQDNVLSTCENVTGGLGDDVLIGSADANTLSGGAGNDRLQGKAGDDVLNGGAGSDTVDYSDRSAAVDATLGATATTGNGEGSESDTIGADVENLKGGSGVDTFTGNDLANEFWGNDGDDILTGGKGDDIFHEDPIESDPVGAPGVFDKDDNGGDTIDGGDGSDTVDYSKRFAKGVKVSLDGTANDGETDISSGTLDTTTWVDGRVYAAVTENDDVKATVENVTGTAFADYIVAVGNVVNNIDGGDGDDYIEGAGGDDSLSGGNGDDVIKGGAGSETIEGGAGTNGFDCGADDDVAFGGVEMTANAVTCELLF